MGLSSRVVNWCGYHLGLLSEGCHLVVITDPVHLTETGYKAIATALAEEFDIPHVVHVRSLTAGPPASGSSSRGQTAGTQVVAQRNANWVEKGVTMDGTAAWAATATTDREEPTGAAAAKLAGGPESGPATGSTRSRKARKQQIVITL